MRYLFSDSSGGYFEMSEAEIKTGFLKWMKKQTQCYLEYYNEMLVHHYIFFELGTTVNDQVEKSINKLVREIKNDFIKKPKNVKI